MQKIYIPYNKEKMQRKEVNKMNKTTKIKQVLLLAIISSFSFACSQDSHLELLEEETIKAGIMGFRFNYEYATPWSFFNL